jgi:hypothetical protein
MARIFTYYCTKCKCPHYLYGQQKLNRDQLEMGRLYQAHKQYWTPRPSGAANPQGLHNSVYSNFHQAEPSHTRRVQVPTPRGPLVSVGRAFQIEYDPYGRSKHRGTRFYHKFGDTGDSQMKSNTILATDGANLFLIKDDPTVKRPYFTERGIIG